MKTVPELLEDAQALGRAVLLGASDDMRSLARALTANLDAVVADLLPRSESGTLSAEVAERLEVIVTDLLSLRHGDDIQLRNRFIDVQRKLTDLLDVASRKAAPNDGATAGDTQLDDEEEEEDSSTDEGESEANGGDRRAAIARSEQGLRGLAEAYRTDAERRSRVVLVLGLIALAAVGVASAMAWYLATRWGDDDQLTPGGFVVRCVPALAFYAVAALLAHQATRMRRGVDELRRLERQLQGITAYLDPLPDDTQDLMRAAMTQRLFPRLIEDDPLREEDWFPNSEELIASINLDITRQLLLGDGADDDDSES